MYPGALLTASPPPPQALQLPLRQLLLPVYIGEMGGKGWPCASRELNLGKHCLLAWPQTSCNFGRSIPRILICSRATEEHCRLYLQEIINSSGRRQVSPISLRLKQTYNAVLMLNNVSLLGAVTASSNACIAEECDCSFLSPQTRKTIYGYFLAAYSCVIRGISYNW